MEFIYSLVSLYKFTKTMFLLNKLNFILALAVSLHFLGSILWQEIGIFEKNYSNDDKKQK